MSLQALTSSQLRPDKALAWNLYDETGELLLRSGFVLSDKEQIGSLLKRGVFVDAEDYKAWHQLNPSEAPPPPPPPPATAKPLDSFSLRSAIIGKLHLLLRDGVKEADFVAHTLELAGGVKLLLDKNPDAALAGIFLQEHSKYGPAHSLDAAILMAMLAQKLGWSEPQRQSAVCAALTMNIAMAEAQSILAQQRLPPTEAQRATISSHPASGAELLRNAGVDDPLWLQMVHDHHEAPDSSGYPAARAIDAPETLLLRAIDIYTALLVSRATRPAQDSATAVKTTFVLEKQHQNDFGGLLVKEIGLYPPGALVKLKNGDVAVVSRRATASAPFMVHSFFNGKGIPMLEPMWRDTTKPEFAVTASLPPGSVKVPVDIGKIWNAQART